MFVDMPSSNMYTFWSNWRCAVVFVVELSSVKNDTWGIKNSVTCCRQRGSFALLKVMFIGKNIRNDNFAHMCNLLSCDQLARTDWLARMEAPVLAVLKSIKHTVFSTSNGTSLNHLWHMKHIINWANFVGKLEIIELLLKCLLRKNFVAVLNLLRNCVELMQLMMNWPYYSG